MTILLRLAAWLLAAFVTFSTLGPPRYRPHSHFGQDGEHALAFILVGLAFAFAYPRQRRSALSISLVAIGALEILQIWMPGRHARLEDFVVDAVAACAGFATAAVLEWTMQQRGRTSSDSPAE